MTERMNGSSQLSHYPFHFRYDVDKEKLKIIFLNINQKNKNINYKSAYAFLNKKKMIYYYFSAENAVRVNLAGWSVGRSVICNFLKGREVALPCSNLTTF